MKVEAHSVALAFRFPTLLISHRHQTCHYPTSHASKIAQRNDVEPRAAFCGEKGNI
jgi:hypothetical protein